MKPPIPDFLQRKQPMRLRISKLKPETLAKLRLLEEGSDEQFISIPVGNIDAALAVLKQQPRPVELVDRIEMRLCGKHREKWVAAGRPLRTEKQVEAIKAVCEGCNHLLYGIACNKHACTHAGRRAATYDCPIGKWQIVHT